jgi:hypothetical protein
MSPADRISSVRCASQALDLFDATGRKANALWAEREKPC